MSDETATATVKTEKLTNSRIRKAQRCLRAHALAYELGLRPDTDAKPLRMGRATHDGLDLHRQGKSNGEAIDGALAGYDQCMPPGMSDERTFAWLIERETVLQLLNGYFWRWAEMDKGMQVLATELAFELPIINPATGGRTNNFVVAGKIDLIAILSDGREAVIESKTTSDDLDPGSDFWKRLRIDSQISIYFSAAPTFGYGPETVLYDGIRKPTIKPRQIPILDDDGKKIVLDAAGDRVTKVNIRKSDGCPGKGHGDPIQGANKEKGWTLQTRLETPEEFGERLRIDIGKRPDFYYARREIPRLEADLVESQFEVWQMQKLLRDCQRNDRWPRNTGACIGFGKCPYFDLCTNGFDINSGEVPDGFVKLTDVHPELQQAS